MTDAYQDYLDGHLTAQQALRALLSDLGEIEDQLNTLNKQRDGMRDAISSIIAREGNQEIGDTRLLITNASVTISYDRKALDDLALRLTATHPEIAAELARCRKESMRAGSLRIEKAR